MNVHGSRHVQTAATALFLAGLCVVLSYRRTLAGDWPQWRGANRDGVWNETGMAATFPPGGLQMSWRTAVGRGWSTPVVAQSRVYVTDVQVNKPAAKERVLCFAEATGRLLWRHEYPVDYPDWAFNPNAGGPRATPIVHEGKVYTLGAMGHLFCLGAARGEVIWEKSLAKEYQVKEFTGITASPLIDGQHLILYICGQPEACVIALDRYTGRQAWKALNDSFTYSSPIVLTAGGQRQFVVWTQQAVTSLDPATGKTWWRERLATPGDMAVSTPVFANGRLLVGGLMFQLDQDKPAATVLWPETRVLSKRIFSNTSTALLQSNHLFTAKTSGELICVEAATGRQLWETNTVTVLKNGSSIHLTPCDGAVYLFTDRGDLIRAHLSPQGYKELSRAHLLKPTSPFGDRKCAWSPPAYANHHVFARNDEELVCASLAARPLK